MWRTTRALYLEPGEVEVAAEAVRRAAEAVTTPHPGRGLLLALADALLGMGQHPEGVVLTPAPAGVARQAALCHVGLDPGAAPRRRPPVPLRRRPRSPRSSGPALPVARGGSA